MIEKPLPKGWQWIKLENVACDIQTGFTFSKKNARGGEILQIRPYNIGIDGELDFRKKFFVSKEALPKNWSPLAPGDVLFNNTNSVEFLGKTALVRENMDVAFSNHITRIRVRPYLCEGAWLALTLNILQQQGFFAQQCHRWIGQAGYSVKNLRKTFIPLPPLSEQQRIMKRLETVMNRLQKVQHLRQKAQEKVSFLWEAILSEIFPRSDSALPFGWQLVRLGEVCEINPKRPRLSRDPAAPTTFVPMSAIDDFSGVITETNIRPFAEVQKGYTYFEEGDVLFAKITPCMENGKSAIARNLIDGFGFGSTEFHVLRPKKEVMSEWIWFFVRQRNFLNSAKTVFRGCTGQQRVPAQFLQDVTIPLPPFIEQKRIVERLEVIQKKLRALEKAQVQTDVTLNQLKKTILVKAFQGEI